MIMKEEQYHAHYLRRFAGSRGPTPEEGGGRGSVLLILTINIDF